MKAERDELRQAIDSAIKRVDERIERKRRNNGDAEQAQARDPDGTDSLVDESDREEVQEMGDSHL